MCEINDGQVKVYDGEISLADWSGDHHLEGEEEERLPRRVSSDVRQGVDCGPHSFFPMTK